MHEVRTAHGNVPFMAYVICVCIVLTWSMLLLSLFGDHLLPVCWCFVGTQHYAVKMHKTAKLLAWASSCGFCTVQLRIATLLWMGRGRCCPSTLTYPKGLCGEDAQVRQRCWHGCYVMVSVPTLKSHPNIFAIPVRLDYLVPQRK